MQTFLQIRTRMKLLPCRFLLVQPISRLSPKPYNSSSNFFNNSHKSLPVDLNFVTPSTKSVEFSNALHVLDQLSQWDVVSATSLISRFAKQNHHKQALHLFTKMLQLNIKPNEFTFGTVIHSSIVLKDLTLGQQIHAYSIKIGLNSNVFVGSAMLNLYVKLNTFENAKLVFNETHNPNVVSYTTLINGYFKEKRINEAMNIFRKIPDKNIVCWNAMISGFTQTGHSEEAVNLFVKMLREQIIPSPSSFPCPIIACSNIAALGIGKSLHACAMKYLGELNLYLFIVNALISFYAKCGNMEDSFLLFRKVRVKNVVTWNALICGYAQNGKGKEAIEIFEKMKLTAIKPNSVSLLGLLLGCNHVGLVDEGYSYFKNADPSIVKAEHYACIVDLFSRSGRFNEAKEFISKLPFNPGVGFWKALLSGCQIYLNMELGEFAAKKIMELDPRDVSSYVMLSNAYSAKGKWREVGMIRNEMKEKGLVRVPGCSWIEDKVTIHVFVTGDKRHIRKDEIYLVLRLFVKHVMGGEHFDPVIEC